MPQRSGDDRTEAQSQPREGEDRRPAGDNTDTPAGHEPTQWFATTAVRAGLTIIGIVLLLFALGQAVGLPLLEYTAQALSSQTGRWLVVAFFAILLIGAAQRITTTT